MRAIVAARENSLEAGHRAATRSTATTSEKRDFSRTAEPKPKRDKPRPEQAKRRQRDGRQFVVQKHDARRVHYDLRLELGGTLKSWAVTRGPSLIVGEKRLAVRTEDHPMQYLDFEGNIPKGEYGGGAMIVWDRGRWEPAVDPDKGLDEGPSRHSRCTAAGCKGRWHLVRMRPRRGEKNEPWLLIKAEDEFARQAGEPDITDEETTSFLSGRTTEELAALGELRKDHAGRAKVIGARKVAAARPEGCAAPARASCRPSSSRACRSRPTRRRAARNGCTRSSTTATASQARIDGAEGQAAHARKGSTGPRGFRPSRQR